MMKEKSAQMHKQRHKLIAAVLIVTAISKAGAFGGYIERWKTQKDYEKLALEVKQEETAGTEVNQRNDNFVSETETKPSYISPVDFKKLAAVNPDVVGWITIPNTNIDYPIVQCSDNETYLNKSFDGKEAKAGSIFLDFESQKELRGCNTVLYGHHMKNGTMFKDVVLYKDEDYFKEHQYFEIYTPKETIHLKAVSCYYIQNDPVVRKTRFRNRESFQEFVKTMLKPCPFAEIPEKPIENLYTLVTCSYEIEDGRTVLFAVEVDKES